MKLGEICKRGPNRIFTADRHIILYIVGHLKPEKVNEVSERIVDILRQ
ncbi:MAG: hypothetical protein J7K81_01435 [Methanophagales archaeon]|nr:hypothetical protein [Methanophagales archaeon]